MFKDDNDQDLAALNDDGDTEIEISLDPTDENRTYFTYEVDVSVIGYNFSFRLKSDSDVWSAKILAVDWEYVGGTIE